MKIMRTNSVAELPTVGHALTKEELRATVGGDSWTRKYADGRTVVYYDDYSVTYFANGGSRVTIYGEEVINMR